MPYWQLYYHFIWGTKNRLPLIDSALEPDLYRAIVAKAQGLGAFVHAIGGMEAFVHAIGGMEDNLDGLKENVIIGRLIPVGTGYRKPGDKYLIGGPKPVEPEVQPEVTEEKSE